MTDRKKLMDMICESVQTDRCVGNCNHPHCNMVQTVCEHLLAKGVTLQRWIPVTERLPEPMVDVVVYRPRMHYKYLVDHLYRGEFLYCRNIADEPCITHWMPLPTPPKEENM